MLFITLKWKAFVKGTSPFIFFKPKSMFEINVSISSTNWNFKFSTHDVFFNINMNMCLSFESEWSTFDMQKGHWNWKAMSIPKFWILFTNKKALDLQEILVVENLKVMKPIAKSIIQTTMCQWWLVKVAKMQF
jgi:hypothetical protein